MRNKQSSSLQKTYDECYLICSTAVYFEGKGNESEALRSWRSALDQIYYHNAYRVPAGYTPKSETEKALKDSLRSMEMQCKERVDLLEALKASREEKNNNGEKTPPGETSSGSGSGRLKSFLKSSRASSDSQRPAATSMGNTIGEGTIPAVNYDGLPKPTPPPLPQRPSMAPKNSSEMAVVGGGRSMSSSSISLPTASSRPSAPTSHPSVPAPQHKMSKESRSPSPEKGGRTMLQTLRSGDSKKSKSSRSNRKKDENPITNKAATLAWNTMGRKGKDKDKLGRSQDPETDSSTTNLHGDKPSFSDPLKGKQVPPTPVRFDSTTRTLVPDVRPPRKSPPDLLTGLNDLVGATGQSNGYPFPPTDPGQPGAVAGHSFTTATMKDMIGLDSPLIPQAVEPNFGSSSQPRPAESSATAFAQLKKGPPPPPPHARPPGKFEPLKYPTYLQEYPDTIAKKGNPDNIPVPQRRRPAPRLDSNAEPSALSNRLQRKPVSANTSSPRRLDDNKKSRGKELRRVHGDDTSSQSANDDTSNEELRTRPKRKQKQVVSPILVDATTPTSEESNDSATDRIKSAWDEKVKHLMKNLPKGVDEGAAKQIFNEIVVQGDEVHWDDVAGLDVAKNALKEAVVYPFLRPDLFMGLREPARGMLLFGPPGTGKTMLARAVATESKSTFFSISASSLTSKFLGESEKLVRALFSLAKALAPSIIFVDEIDSLLSARSGGEHEATRRIKTEFLIQWSDLQRAAAGREQTDKEKERGDASRVLVLAATNLPWAIDEAARRRFVRRQYIPLPEDETRAKQLHTLLGHQKHGLKEEDIDHLVRLTDGFSGSDITALAKDAAMGPLRSLGEKLLEMTMDDIRPMQIEDFQASLVNIRPSVSKQGLQEFEDWAKEFGERGG
ncbi:hypothetical protein ACHAO1_000045 [Botrytis cinerea]